MHLTQPSLTASSPIQAVAHMPPASYVSLGHSPKDRYAAALLHVKAKQWSPALECWLQGIAVDTGHHLHKPKNLLGFSKTLRRLKRPETRLFIEAGVKLHPDNLPLLHEAVEVFSSLLDWDTARAYCETIVSLSPMLKALFYTRYLNCLINGGDLDAARGVLQDALRVYPDDPKIAAMEVEINKLGIKRKSAELARALLQGGYAGAAEKLTRRTVARHGPVALIGADVIGVAEQIHAFRQRFSGEAQRRYESLADAVEKLSCPARNLLVKTEEIDDDASLAQLAEVLANESQGHLALPWETWLIIYDLLQSRFFLKAASAARRQAVLSLADHALTRPLSAQELRSLFSAYIEARDFSEASATIERMRAASLDATFVADCETFVAQQRAHPGLSGPLYAFRGDDWLRFAELIEGKSVAVVGGARPTQPQGEEIDSFDIVIRTNHRVRTPELAPDLFGRKSDISYYNGGDPKTFRADIVPAAKNLLAASFKKKDHVEMYGDIVFSRVMRRNAFMFKGTPNGIQNVLFEISQARPSRVKLFCANFFMSRDPYDKNYRAGHAISGRNWVCHDGVSNFCYVRNLWLSGFLEAAEETSEVLALTADQYVTGLDEAFLHRRNGHAFSA